MLQNRAPCSTASSSAEWLKGLSPANLIKYQYTNKKSKPAGYATNTGFPASD